MQIARCLLSVNCHGWEDFPTHLHGDEAAEVLACWTVMWHPLLLSPNSPLPSWQRVDELLDDAKGTVLLLPSFLEKELTDEFRNRIRDGGGLVVRGQTDRRSILKQILSSTDQANTGSEPTIEAAAFDFFALGYCYLQVMLMTRQLRYSSTLDDDALQQKVSLASQQARSGDAAGCQTALQACFDLLIEERGRYYPSDAQMVDYILVAPTTLGSSLQQSLSQPNPINLQMDGQTLEKLSQRDDSMTELRNAIKENRVGVARQRIS